jgi:hypothetical protein
MSLFRRLHFGAVLAVVVFTAHLKAGRAPVAQAAFDISGRTDAYPWIAASGSTIAVVWGASVNGKSDVFAAVSGDGGATFAAPVQVNTVPGEARLGGELPPRVALARRSGASMPEMVVLWTTRGDRTEIKAARSRDGGRTFAAPVTLQSPDAAGDRGWPAVALDAQARVHAIWLDHRDMAAKPAAAAPAHQPGAPHDGVAMAQKSSLYYGSLNGSAAHEQRITRGVCYCCKTALSAGAGGSLYAAWRHVYPGDLRDMAFTVSRDGGRSFSPVVRVSEDHWAINGCPDDGPALAADGRNVVHMVWPTVIAGANPEGAIFYASTADGRSFTPRVRIPTLGGAKPTHPQIVIDRSGRVVVAWEEMVNGRRVAALREVRPASGGTPTFGAIVTISPDGPATYPVLAATEKELVAVWTTVGEPSRVELRAIALP